MASRCPCGQPRWSASDACRSCPQVSPMWLLFRGLSSVLLPRVVTYRDLLHHNETEQFAVGFRGGSGVETSSPPRGKARRTDHRRWDGVRVLRRVSARREGLMAASHLRCRCRPGCPREARQDWLSTPSANARNIERRRCATLPEIIHSAYGRRMVRDDLRRAPPTPGGRPRRLFRRPALWLARRRLRLAVVVPDGRVDPGRMYRYFDAHHNA
jgi:hypothetical protein